MAAIEGLGPGKAPGSPFDPPSGRLRAGGVLILLAFAFVVAGDATATPSTEWMFLFRLSDFQGWDYAARFFRELHTGIPPALSMVEVAIQLATGDPGRVEGAFYRVALFGAFALPCAVLPRTRIEWLVSLLVSAIFLWSMAARIQPYLDWNYGFYFPLFVLVGLLCLREAARRRGPGGPAAAWIAGAGLCLALAELSRPFFVLLLPLILVCAWRALRPLSRRSVIAFLAPLLLLSGGWHAKIFWLHDGQLLWSNNGGFNLYRGWKDVVDAETWPAFTREEKWLSEHRREQPVHGTGRYRFLNWNSQAHSEKSRALTRAAVSWLVRHPVRASEHMGTRVLRLLRPKQQRGGRVLSVYRLVVPVVAAWVFVQTAWLGWLVVRDRSLDWLALPEAPLLVVGTGTLLLLSTGDAGEEARLVTHALPLLAGLPRVMGLSRDPSQPVTRADPPVADGD